MARVEDELWREVLERATQCVGPRVELFDALTVDDSERDLLGEAKVDELEVTLLADEEVFGLEVAVGVVVSVHVLEPEDDIR